MVSYSHDHSDFPEGLKHEKLLRRRLYCSNFLSQIPFMPLSIVGARNMKPWVKEWMENEILPVLREFPVTVVSGGARGVDQWAHWLSLRAQRGTFVVLPSGLDHLYPTQLSELASREDVVFVSEYPPEQTMRKHHFYLRNRLIALWSPVLIVIQAREKSGSMMTARYAMDMGKTVITLPANPLDIDFAGNNQLLFDGAAMIRHKRDLVAILEQEYFFNSNYVAKEKN